MTVSLSQQEQIWDAVLKLVKDTLNDRHVFDSFFADTKIYKIENNTIYVAADSTLSSNLLNSRYKNTLQDCLHRVTESNYELEIKPQEEFQSKITPKKETKAPFFENCKLNPKYTLDNFVIGPCNKEAVQASLMVADNLGGIFNPLFIYAKAGLGKTHLLHAIGNYIKEKKVFEKVLYITTDAFIDEFIKYVRGSQSQNEESLKDYLKEVDVLLVDDIQFLSNKDKTAEMFFYVFNALISSGKQVILTSDRNPNDLKGLEERLVSRFNMGLSVEIKSPDTNTLYEILKLKIESNGLNINNFDHDGLIYLAENFSSNVRELEGALNRLIFFTITSKHNDKISIDTIKESLHGIRSKREISKITTNDSIIDAVADHFHLTEEQIKSKVRTSQIALARQVSMYLCRNMLNTPYTQIGKIFGRDHSTVMTAVEKVDKLLKTDSQLATAVDSIKKSLKN